VPVDAGQSLRVETEGGGVGGAAHHGYGSLLRGTHMHTRPPGRRREPGWR
jgi:hypothetical protein